MNVVRSAGGGNGGNNDNYKIDKENATATSPISRPTCSIAELMKKTKFSKEQIRHLYRTFKQDSPSGQVSKEHFASIFATLFPTGECYRYSIFLFRNIDRSNTGMIQFEDLITVFSILMHGSIEERLGWIFDLYDLNKDGKITRVELLQLVAAVFQLIAPVCKLNYAPLTNAIEERTNQLFHKWDIHRNGLVHKEDFVQYCLQNDVTLLCIEKLKPDICL
ncbi:hypothetical protein I4U23_023926 [Adineta vaga]|nr:hypothetical protein I4U23_023926 [Adineta vaga]